MGRLFRRKQDIPIEGSLVRMWVKSPIEQAIEASEEESICLIKEAGDHVVILCFEHDTGQVPVPCPCDRLEDKRAAYAAPPVRGVNDDVLNVSEAVPADDEANLFSNLIIYVRQVHYPGRISEVTIVIDIFGLIAFRVGLDTDDREPDFALVGTQD